MWGQRDSEREVDRYIYLECVTVETLFSLSKLEHNYHTQSRFLHMLGKSKPSDLSI